MRLVVNGGKFENTMTAGDVHGVTRFFDRNCNGRPTDPVKLLQDFEACNPAAHTRLRR